MAAIHTTAIRLLEMILLILPVVAVMFQVTIRALLSEDTKFSDRDVGRATLVAYFARSYLFLAGWQVADVIKSSNINSDLITPLGYIQDALLLIFVFVFILVMAIYIRLDATWFEILIPVPVLRHIPLL